MKQEKGKEIVEKIKKDVEMKKGKNKHFVKSNIGVYSNYKNFPDYGGNTSGWARHYDSPDEPNKKIKVKKLVCTTEKGMEEMANER